MTANDSKYYLSYLNQLVDEYDNIYHHSIWKKCIHADYSFFTEEIESSHKAPKFKVGDRVRIIKHKKIFNKGCINNLSREIFVIDFVLKTNPWTYKIQDLNGETIIESFYEKELLQSRLYMKYYPEPDSHTRDKLYQT